MPLKVEILCGGVFVGGDGVAECEEAEVLEEVVEFVEGGVAGFPVSIACAKGDGVEGGEAEEVVAAVLDHVDGEVVAGHDHEIFTGLVSDLESVPFELSAE